jgi:molecular chaperone GrpE
MNSKNITNEKLVEEFDIVEQTPTVDEFIKELEKKEKSLHISSDMVIEVDDLEKQYENIHESFKPDKPIGEIGLPNSEFPLQNSDDNSGLIKQVAELESERDNLKETLFRRQTDFDNYRNRTERERGETFQTILSSLATEILPVLDNLNRALDLAGDSVEKNNEQDLQHFLEGIVLVNQQLNEVFAGMGIQPISAVGEPFDPNFHEAVSSEENGDFPTGTVIEELLRGYSIDNRVIRPSMVKVSTAKNNFTPSVED